MFDLKALHKISKDHAEPFKQLGQIRTALEDRFADMQKEVQALLLSVACGEPLLFIGPPGTGKSRLIRAFCILTGLIKENIADNTQGAGSAARGDYFEYLLTPFTEPGELFGFWDVKKAMTTGDMSRVSVGMMQDARVVYLDEVFNGSSAILNSILTFMNERLFHDRNQIVRVKMECMFGATNQVAETPELRALFDRFVIRCRVHNAESKAEKLHAVVGKGWQDTYGAPMVPILQDKATEKFFSGLREMRKAIRTRNLPLLPLTHEATAAAFNKLAQMVGSSRNHNLSEMSNRRLVKFTHAMVIHRLYEAACGLEDEAAFVRKGFGRNQLVLLPDYFLDNDTEEHIVEKMRKIAEENT